MPKAFHPRDLPCVSLFCTPETRILFLGGVNIVPTPEETRAKIQATVRAAVGLQTGNASSHFTWEMRTDTAFHYDVRAVLLALDEMCAEFSLDFDPAKLPQQSVFRTFPRLANFCAYLEYRLGLRT